MAPLPPRPQLQPAPRPNLWRRTAGAIAIAGGLLAGAYLGGVELPFRSAGDPELSEQQVADRQAAFDAAGTIALTPVPAAERAEALRSMALPEHEGIALLRDLEAQKLTLAYLTLWDDMDEDGDIVRVSSGGASREVQLTNDLVRLAVPVTHGGTVTITGVHDGGGGITLGIVSGAQRAPLPRLRVGQAVPVPIR